MRELLVGAIGDGYLAARYASGRALEAVTASVVRAAMVISEPPWLLEVDWDDWEPGDNDAAIALAADDESSGLAGLLEDADVTIAGLEDTTVERLGNSLAEGMAAGENIDDLAARVAELLGDESRGEIIARTESARAASVAAMDTYGANGIGRVEWSIGGDSCDDCVDNDGHVVKLGDAFPSGDTEPPLHPNCRCAVLPVFD